MSARRRPKNKPAYTCHKPTGQARVRIADKDYYLGRFGSPESRERYDDLIREWVLSGDADKYGITVDELALRFLEHAAEYYRRADGTPTGEVGSLRHAIRPLIRLYGPSRARDFGPLALKAVRQSLIDAGHCRSNINRMMSRAKRMFVFGVENELLPPETLAALRAVPGLRAGRSNAKERPPVAPVADEVVEATLPYLSPVLADMVRIQRLTGCRPGEVCRLRPTDVDRSGDIWLYSPPQHKTEHHGHRRVVCIGPRAQAVLAPYLERCAEAYCFTPADSERRRREAQHAARTTPLRQGKSPGSHRKPTARKLKPRYNKDSYNRAIARAIARANKARVAARLDPLPTWTPHQLRHTAGTQVRQRFGLDAAQVVLGHASAQVSELYAQRDVRLAAEVARKIG